MLWGFDIECANWDEFVIGTAVSERGDVRVLRDGDDVRSWYMGLPKSDTVLAHNGGAYDFLYMISVMSDLEWTARLAGSAIVSMRARDHAECRDTYRLFPESLARWTGAKGETGLACVCGNACGGYCAIRTDLKGSALRRLTDYCVADARAVVDTYARDVARLAADGFAVAGRHGTRLTVGSVAWHTAARMAGIDAQSRIAWGEYDAGRRAYYGGRCEVGATIAKQGRRYDVHAMYPWALTLDVPVGRMRTLRGPDAARAFERDELGIYAAIVEVPDTDLPPLPHRYIERPGRGRRFAGRLMWTTGTIAGWWTGIELRAALAHGARIVSLLRARQWDGRDAVYQPYVEHAYRVRDTARKAGDDRWGRIVKWYANSLSGKLAQRPEHATLLIAENPPDGAAWLGGNVWAVTRRDVSPCAHPHQAAVLTSRARTKLLDRLARHRGEWLYCDTDSTYLQRPDDRDVDDSALGTWGDEGPMTDWQAIAPKVYSYRDADGEWKVRAKGIPRASREDFERLQNREAIVREVGVNRIRSSGGRFERRKLQRRNMAPEGWCGMRTIANDGRTVPLTRLADGRYVSHRGDELEARGTYRGR